MGNKERERGWQGWMDGKCSPSFIQNMMSLKHKMHLRTIIWRKYHETWMNVVSYNIWQLNTPNPKCCTFWTFSKCSIQVYSFVSLESQIKIVRWYDGLMCSTNLTVMDWAILTPPTNIEQLYFISSSICFTVENSLWKVS